MNAPNKPKSRQEMLRQRQQSTFVGRETQIADFRRTLSDPENRRFIFNVWGQGGVGKSTLLRQFREIAGSVGWAIAHTNDAETSVPEVMGQLAEQLQQQGYKLNSFAERYKVYRQKKQELETDPDAPQGFSAFVGKFIAKAGLGLAKQVPSGAITPFLDEDVITNQASEWATYVARKLGNKDEVRLVQEPIEVLTPLFLQELGKVAEAVNLALFFDTYERTVGFLDGWLRDILRGRYGDLPINVILVIAGQEPLNHNVWTEYEDSIARFSLNPFTPEEAKQYLDRKGITDQQVVDSILHLSGCLPVLVATLAVGNPANSTQLSDPSDTAVERFLKWVDDPKRRQVALDAALPRLLNRDIIAVLHGKEQADDLFNWLIKMPFVEKRSDGWVYHDVVRTLMLRHKRLTSRQDWAAIHGKLASYYTQQCDALQLPKNNLWQNAVWQQDVLHKLYHSLCQAPQHYLPIALNEFLAALDGQRKFAERWARTLCQSGKDADAHEVSDWGKELVEGLQAYDEGSPETAAKLFTKLLEQGDLEISWQAVSLARRGLTYRWKENYEKALQDFNQALELNPKYCFAFANRGETYRLLKCHEDALQNFNRAIELDPKNDWAIASRGLTYQSMERHEDALQNFNQAIELNPKNSSFILLRGELYRLMGSYAEAIRDFSRAIELNPTDSWTIACRAEIYRLGGHYAEALQDLNQLIELDPKNSDIIASRGDIYRLMDCHFVALQDLNYAIKLDPKYTWAIATRGETYLTLKRFNQALADFNRVIELDPENDWYLYRRAIIYRALKQPKNATTDLRQATHLVQQKYSQEPENWNNIFNLGLYFLLMGDRTQAQHFYADAIRRGAPKTSIQAAIRDLEDLLQVFPQHPWARVAKAALEKKLMDGEG